MCSLAIVHLEPVRIREFFRVIPASSVRISKLWGLCLSGKSFGVYLIELAHKASPEHANAGSHREDILGEDVLDSESAKANQDISEFSRQLRGRIRAYKFDLHFIKID